MITLIDLEKKINSELTTKIKETKKVVSFGYKSMKGLDCLINNASIFEKDDLFSFINLDSFSPGKQLEVLVNHSDGTNDLILLK